MYDFERFSEYWTEAVDALYYRVWDAKGSFLTQEQVNVLWREEIDKRFFSQGMPHGATIFLKELEEARPELAAGVTKLLREARLELGMDREALVRSGAIVAGAGVGFLASLSGKRPALVKLIGTGASAALAGIGLKKAAQQMTDGNPNYMVEQIRQATEVHLDQVRRLFDQP